MSETSRPWQGTSPGDAGPYSAAHWQTIWQNIIGWGGLRANVGVFLGSGTQPNEGLRVQAQNPASTSIDVLTGAALVQGIAYMNTATVAFAIAANSSGNDRIDTVVVQADYALQTARLAVLQGTPAASPSPPSLTQSANTLWEIPVADIAVANGFTSITQANITSRREWVNAPPGVYLDNILNNSGGTLADGDVVIWDSSADRAVTTTTTQDNRLLAGVWRGRTANGSYGRVQKSGVGYLQATAAITRGDTLRTSTTAKKATNSAGQTLLARALETTSGSGLVLATIETLPIYIPYAILQHVETQGTNGGGTTANAWTTRPLNTEVADVDGLVTISGNQFTPIAGIYKIRMEGFILGTTASFRHRLRNITAGSTPSGGVSPNGRLGNGGTFGADIGPLELVFTANGTDAYAIQYYVTVATATTGLGIAMNVASETEVYMTVVLEKIA